MMKNEWEKYVREQADNYGVEFETAKMLFDLLGEDEAHDGFITELQDYFEEEEKEN